MTDKESLLCAVLDFPDDDAPRMMLADLLEETGEADRAEFVRVQCELARSARPCPQGIANTEVGYPRPHSCFMCSGNGGMIYDCDNPAELRRRERELLKECWTPFFRHLFPEPHGIEVGALTMRWGGRIEAEPHRGFIDSLTISWAEWLRLHERLYYHSSQEVECPVCKDVEHNYPIELHSRMYGSCERCSGSGLIRRPFTATVPCPNKCSPSQHFYGREYIERVGNGASLMVCSCNGGFITTSLAATAQPIRTVRFSGAESLERATSHRPAQRDWVAGIDPNADQVCLIGLSEGRDEAFFFDRVKCGTCDGRPEHNFGRGYACGECAARGGPLNEWTCPKWPTVRFEMPLTHR